MALEKQDIINGTLSGDGKDGFVIQGNGLGEGESDSFSEDVNQ